MGFWGFGVLGFWGFGVLGFWGFGVLGFWGFGVLGFWGFGVLGFWGFGVLGLSVCPALLGVTKNRGHNFPIHAMPENPGFPYSHPRPPILPPPQVPPLN